LDPPAKLLWGFESTIGLFEGKYKARSLISKHRILKTDLSEEFLELSKIFLAVVISDHKLLLLSQKNVGSIGIAMSME
jgi:hypothetical protein